MKMRTDKRELDKVYKRRDRYDIPEWQREEVWDLPRKQLLIDSVLRGWKLPKFYLVKTADQSYDVVDGQQRLAAIFEFLDGDLELSASSASEFGGRTYKELDADISDSVDDFVIDFDEITDASDEDLKEFFRRLQEGLPLNSSEKLNSIHSQLQSFCKKLAKHPFLANKVAFADKRYAHFDVLAKALTIGIEGVDAGLRYEDVKGVFESNATFSESSAVAKRICTALDFLDKASVEGSKTYRSRALTQSMITLVSTFVEGGQLAGKEAMFGSFATHFVKELATEVDKGHAATDTDYLEFQSSINANVKSGAATRHRVLLRKLFGYHPELLDISHLPAVSAGFDEEIGKVAHRISLALAAVNTKYAADHGKDLFKPTNKTVTALTSFGIPAKSLADFKVLVEGLYFTFWEGHGGKVPNIPQSFKDVNTLRTEFEHDVDHGGAGKYKAKKLAHAAVFEKLSGIKSPAAAGPERFPLAQLKLLQQIEKDLNALGW